MTEIIDVMEPFIFEHKDRYTKRYKWSKYIFVIIGIFWTATGFIELLSDSPRVYHYILLIGGPLFIIQAIISEKNQRDRFIKFDNDQIEFKQSWRKAALIPWDSIRSIEINNYEISIESASAVTQNIKLDEYTLSEVRTIKEQIKRFAELKRVNIS